MLFLDAYKKALEVLAKKPMVLWGLSLMSVLIALLAGLFFAFIPVLGIAVGYLISCGMAKVYLDGLAGKEVYSDQLFAGFHKNCFRIAGGMAWMGLWVLIWALIPIVGPIIAVVKSYSYRFVPYLLITRDDISATQALRVSMEMTNGIKGQMFLADLCFMGGVWLISLILTPLAIIPLIGVVFRFALTVLMLAVVIFGTVFTGLYQAYFYDKKTAPVEAAEAVF